MKTSLTRRPVVISFLLLVVLAILPIPTTMSRNEKERSKTAASEDDGPLFKHSYALLVAEGNYKNWINLRGPERDVKELEVVLKRHGFEVTVVMNPTRQEFDKIISEFKRKLNGPNPSRFLFYFTGHGYTGLNNGIELGYIVPSDAPPRSDENGLKATAISMNEMETLARIISPSHVLFVFDSCFSGILFSTMKGEPTVPIEKRLTLPVRLFITAGTDKQQVPDDSVFLKGFIKGLEGEANLNKDKYVTGTELGEFLFAYVTKYTNGNQTPVYGPIGDSPLNRGDFIFEVPGPQKTFETFSLDSQYHPSGWMGDLEPPATGKLSLTTNEIKIDGQSLVGMRLDYKHGAKGWAGIYWQYPDSNWGDKPGFSLVGAKKISFYAKGERGGEIVEFVSGGITGNPYPDKFRKTTGKIVLSTNWKKYTFDLSNLSERELSSVVGAFAWIGSGGYDKDGRLITYIADLKVE